MSRLFDIFQRKTKPPSRIDFLCFGIGNPGAEYQQTRHNAGFMVIDEWTGCFLAVSLWKTGKFLCTVADVGGRKKLALVKPLTFVNRCGEAFSALVDHYHIGLEQCLVFTDDLHLPLGTIRLRRKGSDGGHNGLKSIIAHVGTEFPRLRMGIGTQSDGLPASSIEYVLGEFSRAELPILHDVVLRAIQAGNCMIRDGIETAMNMYNTTPAPGERNPGQVS